MTQDWPGDPVMSRAERRRLARNERRHGSRQDEPSDAPTPLRIGATPEAAKVKAMHRADMERAGRYRGRCDSRHESRGEEAGHTEALSMMVGCFAYLVEHHDIEKAVKMMGGALSDMAGQALIKRAADIKAGRREPFKAGGLA